MSLVPPDRIRASYAEWEWTMAYEWPAQATTWRLDGGSGHDDLFMKVVVSGHYPTALEEAERMRWARPYLSVPEVIDCGSDGDVDWLLTAALAGTDATRHALLGEPQHLVPILARGLLALHESMPVAECPFGFAVDTALAHARERVRAGIATSADLHPEHAHLTMKSALEQLERQRPASEDLVVCHGDYCFPNILLDDAGAVTGYVDLGELAVADRWWDVTLGAWSTTWNVGPGWEDLFYEAYGIARDDERIAFYRLLYDLAS